MIRPMNTALSRPLLSLLALVLGLASATARPQAAPPATVYNVELIVFRATGGPSGSEDWSAGASRSARGPASDGTEKAGAAQVGRIVATLPASSYQLGAIKAKLASSGAYQPIAHLAWSQTASSWGSRAGFTLARLGAAVPGLSGLVYLERGTYLHLGVSLRYAGASGGAGYALNETRRVKFYEKNYYDHPAFGVIALVTPAQGARPAGR